MKRLGRLSTLLFSSVLVLGLLQGGCASLAAQPDTEPVAPADPVSAPPQQSNRELDQLVAPIALYPDPLVAQILAAATYPTEIVEADRWLQDHPELNGDDALAKAVDAQPWDPSVKALTPFPGLLGMMDKNVSWTSSLGEAYVNGQQNVLDAVQVMRQRAQQAGNLNNTQQESVTSDGDTIAIEPADPQVVYVPQYDPWAVYGDPLAYYPGWIDVPDFYSDGVGIEFGVGIGIGLFGGYGWGWHSWGMDWHRHHLIHGDHPYFSHSREFGNHFSVGGQRPGFAHSAGGYGAHHTASVGTHSGAFSGFNHGGAARAFSSRGRSSFGGGFHGGAHGGGGHR